MPFILKVSPGSCQGWTRAGASLGWLDRASWISKLQAGSQIPTFELTLPRLFPLFRGLKVGMLFLGLATSRLVPELRPVLV